VAGPGTETQSIPACGLHVAGGPVAAQPGAEAMQQVMGELQQLGALDPAAQAGLMADLRQTDPAWWPMVVQQFQAAVAYRRRAEGRQPGAADPGHPSPMRTVSGTMPAEARIDAQRGQPVSGRGSGLPGASPPAGAAPERIARLPAADDAALAPPRAPQGDYPATPNPEANPHLAKCPPDVHQASTPPEGTGGSCGGPTIGGASQMSHPTLGGALGCPSGRPGGADDWQAQLGGAIRALESQLQGAPAAPAQVAEQAQLRMLYLLAGRRDDALQPIPSVPPPYQDFWSKQLYGLATWLDMERTADDPRRAAETKQILQEAITRLGESAPLVVRNLAFCTEVQSYGCTKRFKTYEFAPDQEVLLYAEVENFASEPTPKGFHTSLRSSYQIFDGRGQRVADQQFSTTEEYCQNPRRDFFIGYHLRLPKRIYPGKHTLQLTIEDLKSHKVGQSSIELTIKDVDK
jgi:hypothetical protein